MDKGEKYNIAEINIMTVDDDSLLINSSKRILKTIDEIKRIDATTEINDAFTRLIKTQSYETRNKTHVLLADLHMPSADIGINFLQKVRKINDHPFTIVYTAHEDQEELRGISDAIIYKSGNSHTNLKKELQKKIPKIREFWKNKINNIDIQNEEPTNTAKLSPLPELTIKNFDPIKDNPNLLENKSDETYWIGALDFDNTLYEAESKHSILLHSFAKFMSKNSGHKWNETNKEGNLEALNQLISYCDKWENQREAIAGGMEINEEKIEYEEGLEHTANLSALAFKGIKEDDLKKYSIDFVNGKHFRGRFFEYVNPMLQTLKDHGILPVIVTGIPDFLLPAILKKLNLNYGNGMKYIIDNNGRLTGKKNINMGLASEKAQIIKEYTQAGHAVVFGAGDSVGDAGLSKGSTERGLYSNDANGGFLYVNASKATKQEIERNNANNIREGRIIIIESNKPSEEEVNENLDKIMKVVFSPMHKFVELRNDINNPERLEDYLIKLKKDKKWKNKKNGAKRRKSNTVPNLENFKRIRDKWRDKGCNEVEIRGVLLRFLPKIIVQYIMKEKYQNTQDPQDTRIHCEKIGLSYKSTEEYVEKNKIFWRNQGITPPIRISTIPPPSIQNKNDEVK